MKKIVNEKQQIIDECLNICDVLEIYAMNKNDDDAKWLANSLFNLEQSIINGLQNLPKNPLNQ